MGILTPAATDATPALQSFRKGIRDLGYVEGQTIVLDFRFARGILDALPDLAAELVSHARRYHRYGFDERRSCRIWRHAHHSDCDGDNLGRPHRTWAYKKHWSAGRQCDRFVVPVI